LILVNSFRFSSMAQELLLNNWEMFPQGCVLYWGI
jgi:hypothetical protein